jgi:hypothetical protein
MRGIAVVALLLGGCNLEIIDCIDLGNGCEPPGLGLSVPRAADGEDTRGVAVGGVYRLTVEGGYGEIDVDGAEHAAVASVVGETIRLRGRSPGEDRLDISRGESVATHWVSVEAVDRLAIVPREMAYVYLDEPPAHALITGGTAGLVIRLEDEGGQRLIDVDMEFDAGTAEFERTSWDALEVTADDSFDIDVLSGDRACGFTVPVVDEIDDIIPVSGGRVADLGALPSYSLALVCFAGVAGEDGRQVAGLSWEISGGDNLSVPVVGSLAAGGCVHVADPQDGQQLVVRAGGLERTFTVRTE